MYKSPSDDQEEQNSNEEGVYLPPDSFPILVAMILPRLLVYHSIYPYNICIFSLLMLLLFHSPADIAAAGADTNSRSQPPSSTATAIAPNHCSVGIIVIVIVIVIVAIIRICK